MKEARTPAHPSWLKIGALGCAGVIALAVLFFGSIAALTFRGYRRGLDVREEVDRQYGAFGSYRLPADGAVPPDRMTRFLAIRRALMPRCAEVTDFTGAFRSVDEVAVQPEPDVGDLFGRVGQVIRRMPTIGFVFGAYVSDRNHGLLEQGMGFGEYTWIYVASYFGYLGQPPARVFESENRQDLFTARVFPEIARVIERHVAAGGLTGGPWVAELARLKDDGSRVPFRDALPPELAASLEPHRAALEAVACPAAAELDLTITVRRAVGYDHR